MLKRATEIVASGIAIALATGCTLISLDSLQSGAGGATSTSASISVTGGSVTSTASNTSSASSTTSSTTQSSVSASSTGSGCTDAFCAGQTGLDGCGDFDSAAHSLGVDWTAQMNLNGATTGTITPSSSESFSCPGSVRVDMVGSAGDHSWLQVNRSVAVGTTDHQVFKAMVKRTGVNGPLDGSEVFEADFDEAGGYTCQLYIHPDDNPSPTAYFFLQTYNSTTGVDQLTSKEASFTTPTGDTWSSIEVDFDWSTSPATTTAKIGGQTVTLQMMGVCLTKPTTIDVNWGLSYEDRTQTIYLDNLTTSTF